MTATIEKIEKTINSDCICCLEYPTACGGSNAADVTGCVETLDDTTYDSSMIGDDDTDRASLLPVGRDCEPDPAAAPGRARELPAARGPDGPAAATADDGAATGPVAASFAILAILNGQASPHSVDPIPLHHAMTLNPDLRKRFRERYGAPALAIVMARAVAAEIVQREQSGGF